MINHSNVLHPFNCYFSQKSHAFTFHLADVSWTIFVSSPHGYIKRRGIGRRLGEKEEEEKGKEKKDKAFVCTFIAHGLLFNSVRRLTGVQRSRRVGIEWKKKKKKKKRSAFCPANGNPTITVARCQDRGSRIEFTRVPRFT